MVTPTSLDPPSLLVSHIPPTVSSAAASRRRSLMLVFLAVGFCLGSLFSESVGLSTLADQAMTTLEPMFPAKQPEPFKLKRLPTFEEGGVVIFFHVAKTGGTSIRSIFSDRNLYPTVALETAYNATAFLGRAKLIDRILTKNTTRPIGNNVLFLETHGLNSPGMPFLHPYLKKWRRLAEEHGTSFFTFTLMRDPVAYAVSYFNFFNAEPCTLANCPWRLYEPTEGNLIHTTEANNQCLLQARDHWGIFLMKNRTAPSQQECTSVYETMRQDMDWMGTTEAMSYKTLPLLTYMLTHNVSQANAALPAFNVVQQTKVESKTLSSKHLRPTTVNYIRMLSSLDQDNYERIQQEYTLDMWENVP